MAANKRYIIQVGDTVRVDPKKVACLSGHPDRTQRNWFHQLDINSLDNIPEMVKLINKQGIVGELDGAVFRFKNSLYWFPLNVATKIISK